LLSSPRSKPASQLLPNQLHNLPNGDVLTTSPIEQHAVLEDLDKQLNLDKGSMHYLVIFRPFLRQSSTFLPSLVGLPMVALLNPDQKR